MYYTTSGAYRKSKMLIDYATIALTAVIMILFILILFLRSNSGILFPIVFLAGALINGLSGIKAFMNKKRAVGSISDNCRSDSADCKCSSRTGSIVRCKNRQKHQP